MSNVMWIRFEGYARFHAVFLAANGGYWTFCGRFHREDGLRGKTHQPPAKCGCCEGRIKREYLVPEKLLALKAHYGISTAR